MLRLMLATTTAASAAAAATVAFVLASPPGAPGGGGRAGATERVRLAPASIVTIPAGEFVMGSSADDLRRALALCVREPMHDVPLVRRCADDEPRPPGEPMCDPQHFANEYGAHRVWLPGFAIDRTEVTVAQYDRCVSAGACRPVVITPGAPQLGGATQPITGVNWEEAAAYCRYAGGRLPTEAQWERAARGHDGRPFPWGVLYDPRRANHGALNMTCTDAVSDGYALTAPVGSYPDGASPDGLLDMAGNAAEWCADFWDPDESRYPEQPQARRVDPRGPSHGADHVVRGGGYDTPSFALRTTYRRHVGAGERDAALGFRCAYDP